jgi:U3 small nucleolar RNA-associated protein 15
MCVSECIYAYVSAFWWRGRVHVSRLPLLPFQIYSVDSFEVTHSIKYPAPVMGVGLSADNSLLAAGMLDGTLSLRKRVDGNAKKEEMTASGFAKGGLVKEKGANTTASRYFMRGEHSTPQQDDFVATDKTGKKMKLKTHDKHLKKFEYPHALDAALVTQRAPIVIAVLEELVQRGGLRIALSGRDHHSLEPILTFSVRQIDNPQNAGIVIDLANFILDMYVLLPSAKRQHTARAQHQIAPGQRRTARGSVTLHSSTGTRRWWGRASRWTSSS